MKFKLPDVCHTFRSGHRLMVQVKSSWFPLVDRNPQSFVDIHRATEADFHAATIACSGRRSELQSGALGWFAEGTGASVVNLDGVVDGEAAHAVRERRLAAFARSRGVTHLADWDVNVRLFLARSGDPLITRAALRPIGEAEPQGAHERFVLYAIDWPVGSRP